ncbi:MAG: ABC transporter ATP-binding protein [Candidatus Dormibacteria bacterium]
MALLEARAIDVAYTPADRAPVRAVRATSLTVDSGELVGLVGESGCGKSTLGLALIRMLRPPAHQTGGVILFDGVDVTQLRGEQLRRQRHRGFALVPQSGMNALNPVRSVKGHFTDILRAHERIGRTEIHQRAVQLLGKVGLDSTVLNRYPHELSGGMRQRVAIALVLALDPRLIVFDEPTTALDVIVQAGVIATIRQLQQEEGFSALVISHDLGLVVGATDRVVVMYAGQIVEDQSSERLLQHPRHPYTQALLRCYADPRADEVHLEGIVGSPPDLSAPTAGCLFAPRCPLAEAVCWKSDPQLSTVGDGRVACHVAQRTGRGNARGG